MSFSRQVRVVQNDQGSSLPPDLVDAAPRFSPKARPGELVTLVDIDHFVEGNFDADANWVVARAHDLHDHIIETLRVTWSPKTRSRGEGGVAEEKRLPFIVKVPNATTVEAMKELDDGKAQRFDTAEELFRDLDI